MAIKLFWKSFWKFAGFINLEPFNTMFTNIIIVYTPVEPIAQLYRSHKKNNAPAQAMQVYQAYFFELKKLLPKLNTMLEEYLKYLNKELGLRNIEKIKKNLNIEKMPKKNTRPKTQAEFLKRQNSLVQQKFKELEKARKKGKDLATLELEFNLARVMYLLKLEFVISDVKELIVKIQKDITYANVRIDSR